MNYRKAWVVLSCLIWTLEKLRCLGVAGVELHDEWKKFSEERGRKKHKNKKGKGKRL